MVLAVICIIPLFFLNLNYDKAYKSRQLKLQLMKESYTLDESERLELEKSIIENLAY